ncbi:phosphonate ABC transporter, permease protein PhnE [Clostridium sp. C8-1-8]|jgi:phosphonate transport system permease protein|uniref:phosphonate ABC transporter, permease protein PhnE n=1 Tax=Clostridium sp. C8-1-8 TaxID=2698831 RepID=UPI00136ECC50|nr:phosphonate ABC transporter, permease protein PhnE [Clostridium sp. C8-1-8]
MKEQTLKKPSNMKMYLTVVLIVILMVASAKKTDASFSQLMKGLPETGKLFKEMLPPDWSYFSRIIDPMAETIRMAIIGTTIGAILSIPLALLSARNICKSKILLSISRIILNLIRTIPDLLFAAIFVAAFGLGPLAGIFALSFFSLGLVAKLLYESIEGIDDGPMEALTACGGNTLQIINFSVIPQIMPQFISYVLYTFEINVRAAAVLGLVGAGGIGLQLDSTLGLFKYNQTCTIIIATLIMVVIIDNISIRIREKLL